MLVLTINSIAELRVKRKEKLSICELEDFYVHRNYRLPEEIFGMLLPNLSKIYKVPMGRASWIRQHSAGQREWDRIARTPAF